MQIEIVHDPVREKASRGRKAYTFTVDGEPSLYWAAKREHIQRVIDRLRLGRSSEAFGGHVISVGGNPVGQAIGPGHDKPARAKIVSAGEVTTETVQAKSGLDKVREKRPGFTFELDGKTSDQVFTAEPEARGQAAVQAMMTRNRLGRFKEAEKAFKDKTGKKCRVHVLNLPGSELHWKIVAKDEDGGLWHVGFVKSPVPGQESIKFTQVVPSPPKQ